MTALPGSSAVVTTKGEPPLALRLLSTACGIFGVSKEDIRSNRRAGISEARWAMAYVLATIVGWDYNRIGRFLNKNHAAVRYGIERATTLMREDQAFLEAVELLEAQI